MPKEGNKITVEYIPKLIHQESIDVNYIFLETLWYHICKYSVTLSCQLMRKALQRLYLNEKGVADEAENVS